MYCRCLVASCCCRAALRMPRVALRFCPCSRRLQALFGTNPAAVSNRTRPADQGCAGQLVCVPGGVAGNRCSGGTSTVTHIALWYNHVFSCRAPVGFSPLLDLLRQCCCASCCRRLVASSSPSSGKPLG